MNRKELVKIDKSTLSKPIRSHLDTILTVFLLISHKTNKITYNFISNSHLLHANVGHNGEWDGEAQCQSPN